MKKLADVPISPGGTAIVIDRLRSLVFQVIRQERLEAEIGMLRWVLHELGESSSLEESRPIFEEMLTELESKHARLRQEKEDG